VGTGPACYSFTMDRPGLPLTLLVLVLVAMPVGLAVFFGLFTFRRMTPLAFRCLRCGAEFQRKPWRRFPAACPACNAKDWSAP
jgi:hypothetical protein